MDSSSSSSSSPYNYNRHPDNTMPSPVIRSLAQENPGVFSTGMPPPPPVQPAFQDATNTVSAVGRAHIDIQEGVNRLTLEDSKEDSKEKERKIQPSKKPERSSSASDKEMGKEMHVKRKQGNPVDGKDSKTPSSNSSNQRLEGRRPKPPPLSEIHLAALKNNVKVLTSAIDKGIYPVNLKDKKGNTPLHMAVGADALACVAALIARNANINVENENGLTPLHLSVRHNKPDCFGKLIEHGANIATGNNDKINPFHLAAKYDRQELLEALINLSLVREQRELIDVTDSWGQTPLHYAVIEKKVECTKLLIERGADIHKEDATGMTPLLSAIAVGLSECVGSLISKDADLMQKNHSNKNAIHFAIESGNYETAEIVLNHLKQKKGEEEVKKLINETDRTGITPLRYAESDEMRDLLIKCGAQKEIGINRADVNCAICYNIFYHSVTLACGHTFCGTCIKSWRKMNDTCPACRAKVRLVGGYCRNLRMDKLLAENFKEEIEEREQQNQGDALECTLKNVAIFGKARGTEIVLDKNHTSILAIDNELPMHLTYMPSKEKLCVYSPILAQLPKVGQGAEEKAEKQRRLTNIFKTLLSYGGTGFGDGMSGVGVLVAKELIFFHVEIPMKFAPQDTLQRTSISFVELVKQWREAMKALSKGEEMTDELKGKLGSVKFSPTLPSFGLGYLQENLDHLPKEKYHVISNDTDWTIVARGDDSISPISMKYLVKTDCIQLSCTLSDSVPDDLSLYQTLLSGSAFGYRTGGGVFEMTEKGELNLKLNVQLTRTGEVSFSKTTLKDVLPIFVDSITEWRRIVDSNVALLRTNPKVDDMDK